MALQEVSKETEEKKMRILKVMLFVGLLLAVGIWVYPMDTHCICDDGDVIFGHQWGGINYQRNHNVCGDWCEGNGTQCNGMDMDCQFEAIGGKENERRK